MAVVFAGRIADEHMHLSVEKSTRRASVTSGSHQFLRAASARKRRKSLGSNSHTKETILFEVRHLSKNLLSRSRYITIQPMALFRFSLLLQQQCLVSQFLHSWSETQCIIMNDLRRRGAAALSAIYQVGRPKTGYFLAESKCVHGVVPWIV